MSAPTEPDLGTKVRSHGGSTDSSAAVDRFMKSLSHPHKAAVGRLRRIILDAEPSIREGVKWNAPSFRTHEYFATVHLRAKTGVAVILHLGAKVADGSKARVSIEDPEKLLRWLSGNRATMTFADGKDLEAKAADLTRIIRAWVEQV